MKIKRKFLFVSKTALFAKIINFTLIELLVVIAIIALLAAILLPALNTAKKTAQTSFCMNNQHQVSIALMQYAGDFQGWIPGNNIYGSLPGGARAWSVMLAMPKSGNRYGTPDAGIYLPNPMVLYCPSLNPPKQFEWGGSGTTTWFTYGILSNNNSGSWNGYPWTDWTKVLSGPGYWDRWLNLARCPKPSSFVMIGDTIANTAGPQSTQYQFFEPNGNGGWHVMIHTRHNNGSNFAFFDGHGSLVKEGDLKDKVAIRYYCKQNFIEVVLPP
ncbi:MAG TPA: prepilin-type N-terminal cleavage/methylation domain-containing protein [Victivallales bacterium]|nr:prepilin-type N-terminal cleavage/methylation domain-containing protein [Victivallales bacterium]HPO89594.1 prepilin-type N-terminal cleavage/methylation domain-containing protein [Victivallales bacterium]HRR27775.1 prepilin-type N-terminal cleavage/methylation domain-containing protein [Victivallales bacterium]HRU00576.1 prepilin-type N-terminal cleavage/methylation domain-containing protein [Victivallales bacterium]